MGVAAGCQADSPSPIARSVTTGRFRAAVSAPLARSSSAIPILKAFSGANIFLLGGTVTSHGYNLSSDNGGGFLNGPGDQINTDPLLGPLQDNGGRTFTHELLPGSPATDAGDPNFRRSHLPGYAAWEIHPVMALRVVQAHARVLAIKFL
jgi:hypothetical protein